MPLPSMATHTTVNPCLTVVNSSIAIRSGDPEMISGTLGSTPKIRYKSNIVNKLGDFR